MTNDFAAIENIRRELSRIEKSLLDQKDPSQTIIHSLLEAQGKAMEAMSEVFRKASSELRNQEYEHLLIDMPNSHTLDAIANPYEREGWEIVQMVPPTPGSTWAPEFRLWIRRAK